MEKEIEMFPIGRIVITRGALSTLKKDDVWTALNRHIRCDWGECCKEDKELNDLSVNKRLRLLSVYFDRNGTAFWILTEGDRSATTVLLPTEY